MLIFHVFSDGKFILQNKTVLKKMSNNEKSFTNPIFD